MTAALDAIRAREALANMQDFVTNGKATLDAEQVLNLKALLALDVGLIVEALAALDRAESVVVALGEDRKDGDGLIAAVWYLLDMHDQDSQRLVETGHDPDRIYGPLQRAGRLKAEAALTKARAAIRAYEDADKVADG